MVKVNAKFSEDGSALDTHTFGRNGVSSEDSAQGTIIKDSVTLALLKMH